MLTGLNVEEEDEDDELEAEYHTPSRHIHTQSPHHVDSTSANKTNAQFFEAAQDSHSAPQIHIYEGMEHKATIRASQESTAMGQDSKPAIVSSSNSQVINSNKGVKKKTATKSSTPAKLQVYNEPFFHKSKSDVRKEQAQKQKRLHDKQRNLEIDEKIRSQQLINRVSSPDGYGKSAEVDALMYRVTGGTKTALMKSSSLVSEMSKQNKLILKKYQPRPSSTGAAGGGNESGYAHFVDHSSPSPKTTPLPHRHQKHTSPSGHKGTGGKQLGSKSRNKGDSNQGGFLPPVQICTPRQDGTYDVFMCVNEY